MKRHELPRRFQGLVRRYEKHARLQERYRNPIHRTRAETGSLALMIGGCMAMMATMAIVLPGGLGLTALGAIAAAGAAPFGLGLWAEKKSDTMHPARWNPKPILEEIRVRALSGAGLENIPLHLKSDDPVIEAVTKGLQQRRQNPQPARSAGLELRVRPKPREAGQGALIPMQPAPERA